MRIFAADPSPARQLPNSQQLRTEAVARKGISMSEFWEVIGDSQHNSVDSASYKPSETAPSAAFTTATKHCNAEDTIFDYQSVPEESRKEINYLVSRIRESAAIQLGIAVDVGNDLLRAKELLGHSNFLPWLKAEFQWSVRTARNYMNVARFFDGRRAKFADLDLGTAYALVAKSTPEEIRNDLLSRITAGEKVARKEVLKLVAEAKDSRQEARAAAKETTSSVAKQVSTVDAAEVSEANGEARGDARPAADKSAAEELRDALLTLSWCAARDGHRCDPEEVARLLLECDRSHRATIWKTFELVTRVKSSFFFQQG
jgi:hypothetical protein